MHAFPNYAMISVRVLWHVWAALSVSFVLCSAASPDKQQQELIGWRGDTYDPRSAFGYGFSEPVKVSNQPLAYVWRNFISREEAKHIAQLASPLLRQSLVGDNQAASQIRSSYGMFIPRHQDETMAAIERRVSRWTGIPVINHEDMQVLRYSPGQTYIKHTDAHERMATILIYLTDTDDGGETAFPLTTDASWTDIGLKPEGLSPDCAEGHVAVKPEVGTALLFYSMAPGAETNETLRTPDPLSLHTGCPPNEGAVKWTSTIWIHFEPFRPGTFSDKFPKRALLDPGVCHDLEARCAGWAAAGECEKNPTYMLGTGPGLGRCRLACGECRSCADGDSACKDGNRVRAGYLGGLEDELLRLFPPVTSANP